MVVKRATSLFNSFCSNVHSTNHFARIWSGSKRGIWGRYQRQKLRRYQGSQHRNLVSKAFGSGSVVLQGDQGSRFPTEKQVSLNAEMCLNWKDLPPFKKLSSILAVTICFGTKLLATTCNYLTCILILADRYSLISTHLRRMYCSFSLYSLYLGINKINLRL